MASPLKIELPPALATLSQPDSSLAPVGFESGLDFTHEWYGETVAPLDALPFPARFLVLAKQIGIKRKTSAGIMIPETVQDDQQWTHGIALIIKVGPSVYRGEKFRDMGLAPSDGPSPREIWTFEARQPRRFRFDGERYLFLADDALQARVDPRHLHRMGFSL